MRQNIDTRFQRATYRSLLDDYEICSSHMPPRKLDLRIMTQEKWTHFLVFSRAEKETTLCNTPNLETRPKPKIHIKLN